MAADTDSGMPVKNSARMPPMSANGMFSKISEALLNDLNASNSRIKISKMEIGTITDNRFIARS